MAYRIIIILAALVLLGCNRTDSRLEHVAQIVSANPQQALECLDSINPALLSGADSHYYDFLSIKARDKAYITHTSDSLILSVIDYFKGTDLYPETLYYGGRVYSDMGDFPTALQYFHDALDLLPSGTDKAELRGCVLSQTGRLLTNMGMYKQSIPYLKDALELTIAQKDSVNLPYDYEMLGSAYLDINEYDTARIYFEKAYNLALHMKEEDVAFMKGHLAIAYYKEGNISTALSLIRNVPHNTFDYDADFFSAYAANIYYKAGIVDTAYIYAKEITKSKSADYRIVVYHLLLDSTLALYSPIDTLINYAEDYRKTLRELHEGNDIKSSMIQNSLYNYSLHERKSARLAKSRMKLIVWLAIAVVVILALTCAIILRQRMLLKKQVLLQNALQTISELNSKLNNYEHHESMIGPDSIEGLQESINDEISRLKENISNISNAHNNAVETEAYRKIIELLDNGGILKDTDPLWDTIYESVRELSPQFELTLKRISANKLSMQDYRLALLTKLGLSTSQIGELLCKSKSAITYRRKQFCAKVFNGSITNDELNAVLRQI